MSPVATSAANFPRKPFTPAPTQFLPIEHIAAVMPILVPLLFFSEALSQLAGLFLLANRAEPTR